MSGAYREKQKERRELAFKLHKQMTTITTDVEVWDVEQCECGCGEAVLNRTASRIVGGAISWIACAKCCTIRKKVNEREIINAYNFDPTLWRKPGDPHPDDKWRLK